MHGINKAISESGDRLTIFNSAIDNLVVNIGDVADIKNLITAGAQPSDDHIKDNHDPGVTNVAEVIYRHAADIHLHLAGHNGLKCLL